MNTLPRTCVHCERPIAECTGFVLARDLLDTPPKRIRERCGHCAIRPHPAYMAIYCFGPWQGHTGPTPYAL